MKKDHRGAQLIRLLSIPQADGTFRVRVDMPNKRQVLPIVASVPQGGGRQTVVMAIERNTKVMEPYSRDVHEE